MASSIDEKKKGFLIRFTPRASLTRVPDTPLLLIKCSDTSYFCVTQRCGRNGFSLPEAVGVHEEHDEKMCSYATRSFESLGEEFWKSFGNEGLFLFQILMSPATGTWSKLFNYPVKMIQEGSQISFWKMN